MQSEKLYYFSMHKHEHDILYRYNRVKNIIMDLESKGKPSVSLCALYVLRDKLSLILSWVTDANGVALLPAKLYNIAIQSVAWAAANR